MGSSTSNVIVINLEPSNLSYFTGETISGTVDLNIIQGKIEADEIYIQLIGEIGYTKTTTVLIARTSTEYHHDPFYSTKYILARSEVGQEKLIYHRGQYSWPFHLQLTNYLPPTINQPKSYPHVRYYLQVVIDKPWYEPNKTQIKYLTIYPRVNLLQNPQCLQTIIFFNQNRKDIILKGKLNKTGYVPGESIKIILEIENPRKVLIQCIVLRMLQLYHIEQSIRRYTIFQTTFPRIFYLKDEQIKETFFIIIPSVSMPPTYPSQGRLHRVASVTNNYIFRFAVKVKGIFTDFDVEIPITIGTEPTPDLNQQLTCDPMVMSYSSNSEQSMFTNHDLPPDYDFVMQHMR